MKAATTAKREDVNIKGAEGTNQEFFTAEKKQIVAERKNPGIFTAEEQQIVAEFLNSCKQDLTSSTPQQQQQQQYSAASSTGSQPALRSI